MNDAPALRNRLLLRLSESERAYLLAASRAVAVEQRYTFYEAGQLPREAFFPDSGMVSEVVRMADGRLVDGSPVGRDGFVGVPTVLGVDRSYHHCVMQVSGEGRRIPAERVAALLDKSAHFRSMSYQFLHARFVQATQGAACNLLHTMEQRLARWLLITCRHTGSPEFHITHEYIAEMLGANRTTVSLKLGHLRQARLIDLDRGLVRIRAVEELRSRVCECYGVISDVFDGITDLKPGREENR